MKKTLISTQAYNFYTIHTHHKFAQSLTSWWIIMLMYNCQDNISFPGITQCLSHHSTCSMFCFKFCSLFLFEVFYKRMPRNLEKSFTMVSMKCMYFHLSWSQHRTFLYLHVFFIHLAYGNLWEFDYTHLCVHVVGKNEIQVKIVLI